MDYALNYYCKHPFAIVKETARNIKHYHQRGRRGWSDRDVWNFHAYHAKLTRDCLNQLAAKTWGYPSYLPDVPNPLAWNQTLRFVADGFDSALALIDDTYYVWDSNLQMYVDKDGYATFTKAGDGDSGQVKAEKYAAAKANFEAAFEKFGEIYFACWD